MNKPFSFRRMLIAPAMLLLSTLFLNSCTEEMPILTPPPTPTNISTVVLSVGNKNYTIINNSPGYVYFANVTVGSGTNLSSQFNVSASNSSSVSPLDYILNFGVDANGNYLFTTSQLNFNNKTYVTTNSSGKAQLKINQLDTNTNTANGNFAYYLYNSVTAPTDSIYVTGTFNIVK